MVLFMHHWLMACSKATVPVRRNKIEALAETKKVTVSLWTVAFFGKEYAPLRLCLLIALYPYVYRQ